MFSFWSEQKWIATYNIYASEAVSILNVAHRVPTPPPPFLYSTRGKAGRNNLKRGKNYPPPPHWVGRAIQPSHIKFRTCSALSPMWTPPINESADQTRRSHYLIQYSEMLPAYGYVAGGTGLHEAEGGGQEAHLQHPPERASKNNTSGIFSRRVNLCSAKNQYWKLETNITRKGISGPQSQFPHSCVCARFIYSHDWSAHSAAGNMWTDSGSI